VAGGLPQGRQPSIWPNSRIASPCWCAENAARACPTTLIKIEVTPNIEIRLEPRVVDGRGETRLDGLTLEDPDGGQQEGAGLRPSLALIGAEPRTE